MAEQVTAEEMQGAWCGRRSRGSAVGVRVGWGERWAEGGALDALRNPVLYN